jgi:hyperpolarization activated cyclic nucleotide-gated potassium channel 2
MIKSRPSQSNTLTPSEQRKDSGIKQAGIKKGKHRSLPSDHSTVLVLLQDEIQWQQTSRSVVDTAPVESSRADHVAVEENDFSDGITGFDSDGEAAEIHHIGLLERLNDEDRTKFILVHVFHLLDFDNDGCLTVDEASHVGNYVMAYGDQISKHNMQKVLDGLMPQIWNAPDKIDFPTFTKMVDQTFDSVHGTSGQRQQRCRWISQLYRRLLTPKKKSQVQRYGNDLLINPRGRFHKCWESVISLCFLMILVTVPLVITWVELIPALFPLHMTIDAILMLNIVKSCFTGIYQTRDGAIVMKRSLVCKFYFRHHFFLDALAATPIDLYLFYLHFGATSKKMHLISMARLVKFVQLHRLRTLSFRLEAWAYHALNALSMRCSDGVVKLMRLMAYFMILAHWSGCFQFLLVRMYDFPVDSWVVFAGLDSHDLYDQWKWSCFKAMCQMILIGFATPPLVNASCNTLSEWCQLEMWTTLLCGLFPGAVFFSLLIASITRIVETSSIKSRRFEERFNNLSGFLDCERHLTPADRYNIKADFIRRHRNGCFYDEQEALNDIDPHRIDTLRHARVEEMVSSSPVFRNDQNRALLQAMTRYMKRVQYRRSEVVADTVNLGEYVYFVSSGLVDLVSCKDSTVPFAVLKTGDSFGYESLYSRIRMSAVCQTDTVLFRIAHDDWTRLIQKFPASVEIWRKQSNERLSQMNRFEASMIPDNII